MASKSKDVRIEQLRIFEKKLALRLQQLDKKGISKEKAQSDPLVKSLKSKIRETNVRIAAVDKFVQRNQELAQAKAQKLVELTTKKEEKEDKAPAPAKESSTEAKQAEAKPKKKAAETEKEPKKQPEKQPASKDEAPVKEPKKQAAATEEAAPKKTKKQPAAADETAPKKKAAKKKEE
jgi:hypothetical protein